MLFFLQWIFHHFLDFVLFSEFRDFFSSSSMFLFRLFSRVFLLSISATFSISEPPFPHFLTAQVLFLFRHDRFEVFAEFCFVSQGQRLFFPTLSQLLSNSMIYFLFSFSCFSFVFPRRLAHSSVKDLDKPKSRPTFLMFLGPQLPPFAPTTMTSSGPP